MAYVRPDELWGIGGTVTGTVASDYQAAWLVDGKARRPVRGLAASPAGDLSLSIAGTSGEVGVVAIAHHNVIVPVTVGGDVTATITPAATRPPNGISLNAFELVTPAVTGVDNLTVDVTGNDQTVTIGEFFAGKVRTLAPLRLDGQQIEQTDFSTDARARRGIPEFDSAEEGRVLSGSQVYSESDLADIIAWWQAQRSGSLPSLLIPDPDINDLWVVKFTGLRYVPVSTDQWLVSMTLIEIPRVRW